MIEFWTRTINTRFLVQANNAVKLWNFLAPVFFLILAVGKAAYVTCGQLGTIYKPFLLSSSLFICGSDYVLGTGIAA